jgi:hypothetical protein
MHWSIVRGLESLSLTQLRTGLMQLLQGAIEHQLVCLERNQIMLLLLSNMKSDSLMIDTLLVCKDFSPSLQ